jgi:sulfur-oxidizing protein SoxB
VKGATFGIRRGNSVNQATEGPPIWDIIANHLKRRQTLSPQPRKSVRIVRARG